MKEEVVNFSESDEVIQKDGFFTDLFSNLEMNYMKFSNVCMTCTEQLEEQMTSFREDLWNFQSSMQLSLKVFSMCYDRLFVCNYIKVFFDRLGLKLSESNLLDIDMDEIVLSVRDSMIDVKGFNCAILRRYDVDDICDNIISSPNFLSSFYK